MVGVSWLEGVTVGSSSMTGLVSSLSGGAQCAKPSAQLLQTLAAQAAQPQALTRPSKTMLQKAQLARLPGRVYRMLC